VQCDLTLLLDSQCTSVHPRLALLTGTLANAADDLWHTAILTCILMLCFAGIGTWRFGNTRDDFGDSKITLRLCAHMTHALSCAIARLLLCGLLSEQDVCM